MTASSERSKQAIARLTDQFLALAPERLAIIEQAATAMNDGALADPLRGDAVRVAHNLAGMAPILGFKAVNPIARRIERQLAEVVLPGDARQARLLLRRLTALRGVLQRPEPAASAGSE